MAKSKKNKKRLGQGPGTQENKNKQKVSCIPCGINFKSCSNPPVCPKCRKALR